MSELTPADEKLLEAAYNGDLATIKKALLGLDFPKKADIEVRDSWQQTALIIAAANGYQEIIQYLIENGSKIEARNNTKKTALIKAAENGHQEVLQYLIKQGANIEAKDKDKETPLIKAAQNGNKEAVQCLIKYGANIKVQNKDGKTALDCAKEKEHSQIVQYLEEVYKNPEKYQLKSQEELKHKILKMLPEQLAHLPQSDPALLQKIVVFGQLATVFERLPYTRQMPLYKVTRDKMTQEEKKTIEDIIRTARQNQKSTLL